MQSRYYDPIVKRFLNADSYGSTGQGFLGYNMFAYCSNNPVTNQDPNGNSFIKSLINKVINAVRVACLYAKYGKPTSELGAARRFKYIPESENYNDPNCYAFSEGENVNDQPGLASGMELLDYYRVHDVEEVYYRVEQDQITKGRSIRRLSGPDDSVFPNEYRVALRVGTELYYDPYESFWCGEDVWCWDYHFMVQVSDGSWAEKHGALGASYCNPVGQNPNNISWNLYPGDGYYDSQIIYYAVGG